MEKVIDSANRADEVSHAGSKIASFKPWLPYVVAACLMAMGIYQTPSISTLKHQLSSVSSEVTTLKQSNALMGLHLSTLEAKDPAYAAARVTIAWDPNLNRGVVSVKDLAAAPAGHDYQLWVLDPHSEAPISAGLLTAETLSSGFKARPLGTSDPGFAVSLEPTGGQSTPTGPILFAVAPRE